MYDDAVFDEVSCEEAYGEDFRDIMREAFADEGEAIPE